MPHQCTEVFVLDTQGRPLVARRRRSAPLEADPRSPGATSLLGPYCADPKKRLGHAEVATGAPDGARFSDECGIWKDPHGRDAFITCPWRPQRVPATGVGSVPGTHSPHSPYVPANSARRHANVPIRPAPAVVQPTPRCPTNARKYLFLIPRGVPLSRAGGAQPLSKRIHARPVQRPY